MFPEQQPRRSQCLAQLNSKRGLLNNIALLKECGTTKRYENYKHRTPPE